MQLFQLDKTAIAAGCLSILVGWAAAGSLDAAGVTVHLPVPDGSRGDMLVFADETADGETQATVPEAQSLDAMNDGIWRPPEAGGFMAYLEALQAERYTQLLYRWIASDVRAGRLQTSCILFQPYFSYVTARGGDGSILPDFEAVGEDVGTALRSVRQSTALTIPEDSVDPLVAIALRVARHVHAGDDGMPAACAGSLDPEVSDEPSAERRAEATGLLHDAVGFTEQPHLRFLFAGDTPAGRGRLLVALLRVARADGHVVDEQTVEVFVDRLVEADALEAAQRDNVIERVWQALDDRHDDARQADRTSETVPETVALPSEDTDDPAVEPDAPVSSSVIPVDKPQKPAPVTTGDREARTDRPRRADTAEDVAAADSLELGHGLFEGAYLTLEGGLGAAIALDRVQVTTTGQSVSSDADLAARAAIGLVWPKALGSADLSLSLVGIFGRNESDTIRGPGAFAGGGSDTYFGVLPFVSTELPVGDRFSLRAGGGLGIAHRRFEIDLAGGGDASTNGAVLLAQVGGGIRYAVSSCFDVGVDGYATYLGDLDDAPGASSTWDLALLGSVRFRLPSAGVSGHDRAGTVGCL